MSWNVPGNFLENSRKCFSKFLENFVDFSRSWKCPGHVLEISRKMSCDFPELSRIFPGKIFRSSWIYLGWFPEMSGKLMDCSRKFPTVLNRKEILSKKRKKLLSKQTP